ncbi:hypothetical protein VFPPC_02319 [Pochonia chlamydosporia 170]|uniref:Uncharacterized protein n=1 Tax=Pochonia chlamydosporia 170 TaxID=1380566 RepID=A0A179FWX5_METCM|nr:hypothetical protein VFPPC_02319 [Pochonia chlamydosporia 170]OAQ69728.1 hypothetical protein VFPPC_02319 [Pochonia chlamydosporia 170]
MTLGTGLYINLEIDTPISVVVVCEVVGLIGVVLLFQTPMIAIQSQAGTAKATSTLGSIRNVSTALSIVLGGAVLQNSMASRQSHLAAGGLGESVTDALSGDKAAANVRSVKSIQNSVQRRVVQGVLPWSIRNMFIMCTCLAALAVLGGVFVKHTPLSE